METVEYAHGRLADLYGDPTHPTVLLWHGSQSDARAAVRSLAELLAARGVFVVAPDWNSKGDDGGRADLLRSAHFARGRATNSEGFVVVGWSLGGLAAAGLTIHARDHGVRVTHTVCLAGAFMVRDPICGAHLETELAGAGDRSPFTLLHGLADDIVPPSVSRSFASSLQHNGWPAEFVTLDADHGSIAGAFYDAAADKYFAAKDSVSLGVAEDVAARIAAVAGR